MKVRLAVQTLSSSVADALDFCEYKLKLPQFQGERGGYNNNPTACQFRAAYKRLLFRTEVTSSDAGNCCRDVVSILNMSSAVSLAESPTAVTSHRRSSFLEPVDDEHDYTHRVDLPQSLSAVTSAVVPYIAGFVARKPTLVLRLWCAFSGGNVLSETRLIMDRIRGLSTSVRNSPLPSPTPNHLEKRSAKDKGSKFLRRLIHVRHMDFQFAMWQMLYLFVSPQKVYRNFQYRKQTKDQFARDDPAFLVLLGLWLVASSVGFVLILRISFLGFLKFLLWVIFIDCIGMGVLVATALWVISNKYLLKPTCRTEDVEWGYAFDVHLNAFFPPLVVLHVFQLFFSRSLGYYIYITFLGYSALPILKNTHIFLYPLALLFVCYVVTLVCNVNLCEALNDFYAYRVM
ncbi:hypothetical protein MRX96_003420 [Rhipicephalus microplus]